MRITPLASSSAGNAYLITDGTTEVLLDCGISVAELKEKSDFKIPYGIDACFITHSHRDHSRSLEDLLNLGVDCYLHKDTVEELNIQKHYRLHTFEMQEVLSESVLVNTLEIKAIMMHHDVTCVGFWIYSRATKERLLFATDTCRIPYLVSDLDYIMIEANYDIDIVNERIRTGHVRAEAKPRLLKSHMSIDSTVEYLKQLTFANNQPLREVYLMHLSSGSSDADDFKQRVQEVVGCPVIVCEA